MPTNRKPTSNKRQREQDQKERAAERIARRTDRRERAAARQASGQVGPQIADPAPPEGEVFHREPVASTMPPGMGGRGRPERAPTNRRIYVGNLPDSMDANAISALFSDHGVVADVHVVLDPVSRRPRGFAFVTMGSAAEAQAAIAALDGREVDGRALRVNQAEPRESGPSMGRGRY